MSRTNFPSMDRSTNLIIISASALSVYFFTSFLSKITQKKIGYDKISRNEEEKEVNVEFYFKKTERNEHLFQGAYNQIENPWGFENCHFASILAAIRPSPFRFKGDRVRRRLQSISIPAGGEIEVEFFESCHIPDFHYDSFPSYTPLIILLHGVTGSSKEPYIEQAALQIVNDYNWRALVFNYGKVSVVNSDTNQNRKYNNDTIPSSVLQGGNNFVDVGDLNFLISHLRKTHHGFIGAIGFSMGGAKLVHFLGRTKKYSNLDAACCISSPLDYTTKNVTIVPRTFVHRFYHFAISSSLKLWVLQNYDEFKKHPKISTSKPFRRTLSGLMWWLQSTRVTDVDEEIIIHGKGYTNLNQYYQDASGMDRLKNDIEIPFLYLTATNDPFVPPEIIPDKNIAHQNENIFIVKTRIGGHLGFYYPGKGCWATKTCLLFFDSVKTHINNKQKSISFHRQSSLKAADSLQNSSSTHLTNYYKLIARDSAQSLVEQSLASLLNLSHSADDLKQLKTTF